MIYHKWIVAFLVFKKNYYTSKKISKSSMLIIPAPQKIARAKRSRSATPKTISSISIREQAATIFQSVHSSLVATIAARKFSVVL